MVHGDHGYARTSLILPATLSAASFASRMMIVVVPSREGVSLRVTAN
jgi:hypothetical protein